MLMGLNLNIKRVLSKEARLYFFFYDKLEIL